MSTAFEAFSCNRTKPVLHLGQNLYAIREPDGGIRLVRTDGHAAGAAILFEVRMSASEWASTMLGLSRQETGADTHDVAWAFHRGDPVVRLPKKRGLSLPAWLENLKAMNPRAMQRAPAGGDGEEQRLDDDTARQHARNAGGA